LSNPSVSKRSKEINKLSTSNENKKDEEEQKEKINKNFLNFIPRSTNQRIGKSSRLMLPISISKITKSTEDISMKQK
jgi:hypothetical protein